MIKIEPQMLQIVLEAIHDLHIQEQIVDRDFLPELTGLNLGVIDRCVSLLIEQGGTKWHIHSHSPASP